MKKIITSFLILSWFIAGPVFANTKPNDPYFNNQWYLSKIKADSAWDIISDSPDIVIAVIDSGIDLSHPDLRDNIWYNPDEIIANDRDDDNNGFKDDVNGWDFVDNDARPTPQFKAGWTEAGVSHGTMIAGIIAARGNNSQGVSGVTWRTQIMPLRALDDKGAGLVSNVIKAIDYAVDNGAEIINLSFVNFNYNAGLQAAIRRAHEAGVIVVAAAGNEQAAGEGYNIDKTPIYPACYDGDLIGENMVIGVAATDALDQKAAFSSYGFRCVDIAAPGISFFNTITAGSVAEDNTRRYDGYWSGTSMAAPLVSATLALIKQANPELSRREVVNILFAATDNISRLNPDYLGQLGNGRLNVSRAVKMAKEKLYNHLSRLMITPLVGKKDLHFTAANGNLVATTSNPTEVIQDNFNLAAGDVNGDGQEELVLGAAAGHEPWIKVLTKEGKVFKQFLALEKSFRGGLNIAVADLDDDGTSEIIVGPASAGLGQVKIFEASGRLKKQFYIAARNWRGGFSVAAGDLEGRGTKQIIVGYGAGHEPQIRIFNNAGRLLGAFLAYEKNFRGGVNVAVANLDGRKDFSRAEIIVAPGPGREPLLKVFDNRAKLKRQFLAYNKNWKGGVKIAAGDLTNDGLAEIVVGAYPGAAPHVRVFDGRGILLESFYAWEEGFKGGANVGIIRMNN